MAVAGVRGPGRARHRGRRGRARRRSARRLRALPEHHSWLHPHGRAARPELTRAVRCQFLLRAPQTGSARSVALRQEYDDRLALGACLFRLPGFGHGCSACGLRLDLAAILRWEGGIFRAFWARREWLAVARAVRRRAAPRSSRRRELFGQREYGTRRIIVRRARETE